MHKRHLSRRRSEKKTKLKALMLHVINATFARFTVPMFSWIPLFTEELYHFNYQHFQSPQPPLFSRNVRHSGDHCVPPERRQVRTRSRQTTGSALLPPSIPSAAQTHTHTQKMSTQGKAFLPCHPSHPSVYPPIQSTHQGGFPGTQARNR